MRKVIAYVHTHWDREWYREFEEFRLRLIEVVDEIINAITKKELPFFYFDGQTAAIEDYLEIHPERLNVIKKLIKEKKLRIGPFYCSADSLLVSGECLYRNFEIGIKKAKELGETDFIGYLADTFGHSKDISYIFKALNINKACVWRGIGNTNADIIWNGINTTNLIKGYYQDFLNSDLSLEKKAELLQKYIDKISDKSGEYILLPIGADHLSIPKNIKTQIKEINQIYKDYKIEIATPFEYFKHIKNREKINGELLDNSLTFILPGVYSSRLYIKQANAKSQWLLTNIAEPIQAFAHYFYNSHNKQKEIDYAYKMLIKNHAHDSIYGCSLDSVCQDVMQRFYNTDIISKGIIKRTIRDLSSKKGHLSVINLSNNTYSGSVKIITDKQLPNWMNPVQINTEKGFTDEKLYNINEIPITEDITNLHEYIISVKNLKPFSITKITNDNICNNSTLKVQENSIENEFIKLEVIQGLIKITDKKRNEEYSDFITIEDRADIGDSYNFGPLKNDKHIKAVLKSYKVKENNFQRAVLNLNYEINIPYSSTEKGRNKKNIKTEINIDAILYNITEYIEFKTKWVNKSKNHILQIGFNLKDKITTTLNEDLYSTTERKFNPDFDINQYIPAERRKEIKPNTSPMQRFMSTQNFALITKGNTEYEIIKNTVYLTLLRATGIISTPNNPSRGISAGPPLNIPKLQCLGVNTANFAVAFTNKSNELYKFADYFYNPVYSLFCELVDKQFLNINNNNIRLTSVQTKENGINLRLFNNSEENQNCEIACSNKENIKFLPYEIKNIDFKANSR